MEATGPWHRVSWLETSMMQCVYETVLRYNLELEKTSYMHWLNGALLRCAKSVAFTRLIQSKSTQQIKPALFTGRRTGGLLFLLLQNLFFAEHFYQFNAPGAVTANLLLNKQPDITECLSTSSCDAWYILTKKLQSPCCYPSLNPIGTHAHELQMVISTLYPHLDKEYVPYSQVLSYYLYYKLVWQLKPYEFIIRLLILNMKIKI